MIPMLQWTSMNWFLTNLALSDLLVLTVCLTPTVINDITKTFWFSAAFCKAILFFQAGGGGEEGGL